METEVWKYMVALRHDILSTINGISNAESYLWWDNTTPNSTTRRRLRKILENALQDASAFGVYVVARHLECGRRSHNKVSDDNGYLWDDPYGLNVTWQDPRFLWKGDQLFQGARFDLCPCSKSREPVRHHVIEDFICNEDVDPSLYRSISSVLTDIQSAIDEAGDKKPRSGIREHLLRAVLLLNDAIMPFTVEAHIAAVTSGLRA